MKINKDLLCLKIINFTKRKYLNSTMNFNLILILINKVKIRLIKIIKRQNFKRINKTMHKLKIFNIKNLKEMNNISKIIKSSQKT